VNLRAESRLNFNAAVLARLRSQAIDLAVHPVSACHGLQGHITLAPPMARSAYPAENSGTAAAVCGLPVLRFCLANAAPRPDVACPQLRTKFPAKRPPVVLQNPCGPNGRSACSRGSRHGANRLLLVSVLFDDPFQPGDLLFVLFDSSLRPRDVL
jgi:hypothetical protein